MPLAALALLVFGGWFVGFSNPATTNPSGIAVDGTADPSLAASAGVSTVHSMLTAAPVRIPDSRTEKAWLDGLNLADNLEDLTARARHNPALAHALARALQQCSIADTAYAALAENAGRNLGPEQASKAMTAMDKQFEKCVGLSGSHQALMFELAGLAANAGILEAQLDYQSLAGAYASGDAVLKDPKALAEYVDNVKQFTARAAATGDPNALYRAYELHSDGKFGNPDPVRAYRYLVELHRARSDAFSQRLLDRHSAAMSPNQLRAAQASR